VRYQAGKKYLPDLTVDWYTVFHER